MGKTSKPKISNDIQSTTLVFQWVPPAVSEDSEALSALKEKGWQEAITLATKFQNPSGNPQQAKVVIVQQNVNGDASPAQSMTGRLQKGGNYIEDRQNKKNQVLEKFIKEAKRKGEMTTEHDNSIRESFRIRQEAEEKRLREEERQKQVMLDEALAKKLQEDEEKQLRQQVELEEREKLWLNRC